MWVASPSSRIDATSPSSGMASSPDEGEGAEVFPREVIPEKPSNGWAIPGSANHGRLDEGAGTIASLGGSPILYQPKCRI